MKLSFDQLKKLRMKNMSYTVNKIIYIYNSIIYKYNSQKLNNKTYSL